jgi:Ca-activated chloride channel family protein
MESLAAHFSRSRLSSPARAAFTRADRKWKRTAMLVALVPALAAALAATAPYLVKADLVPSSAPRSYASPEVQARTPPRSVLEPREAAAPPRLRQVSLRGRNVDFGQGILEASAEQGASRPFVLKHTEVLAQVTGFVSAVTVTQEFENPFATAVEAVYVFPLPDDAAVDQMTLTAGDRVIRASIQKRETARRMYEEAKNQGRRAALLDQERPNIFTQSVANLLPGETVKVTLRYLAPLRYDDGVYTLNFPMVVGPRYIPGAPVPGESQGTGLTADTDQVLDASRITPPAERTGRDIAITVRLDTGSAIEELSSVSHRLWAERPSAHEAVVSLDGADRIPNKDFILRWKVAGHEKRAALLATGGPGGTFSLMLMPEARDANPTILPKELMFVIDTSCSMTGPPLEAEKKAMRAALEQMNPDDTFMLINFADRASSFHDAPLPNTPPNVQRALAYLDALPASGGTNQLDGVEKALGRRADPARLRMVLFMTDGFIGNEAQVLAAVEKQLGAARLFGFGVGTSVNHYLLTRLSEVGRGAYQYVRPDEDPQAAVERFVRRIERPLLTDVEVDWGGLSVSEVLPRKVPDLFDAQPLVLLGRYKVAGRGVVTLRGKQNGRLVETRLDVTLPESPGGAPGLSAMWARARIEELDRQQFGGEKADVIRDITTLGLEHHLVTAYTSLVAVDEVPAKKAGPIVTVTVPTEVPDLTNGVEQGAMGLGMSGVGAGGGGLTQGPTVPKVPAAKQPEPDTAKHGGKSAGYGHGDGRYGGGASAGDDGLRDPASGAEATRHETTVSGKRRTTIDFSDDTIEGNLARPDGEYLDARKKVAFQSLIKVREDFNDKLEVQPRHSEVMGSLDVDLVRRYVKRNLPAVRACYDKALALQPGLSGKLVLQWTIGADGKVRKASVTSSTLGNPAFEACVLKLVEGWTFPAPAGGGEATMNYPMVFSPGSN